MSYPYRVVIRKTVSTEVRGEDSTQIHLRPVTILPEDQMRRILQEILQEKGYQQDGSSFKKKPQDNVELIIDPETMTVTAQVQLKETIHQQIERKEEGDEWDKRSAKRREEEVRRRLEAEVETLAQDALSPDVRRQKNTELQTRAGQILEETADARRTEVERLLVEVHARALKEKASSLGAISYQEEHWNQEEYELTIKITE